MDNEYKTSIGEHVLMIVAGIVGVGISVYGALKNTNDAFALTLWCYIAALDVYILGREIFRWRIEAVDDLGKIDGTSREEDD